MSNPANVKGPDVSARKRIPLSTPRRKLEVPPIDGFHLYWFLESNVSAALQGGYDFVKIDEVSLNNRGVGTDTTISGNADLGTNIRVVGGVGGDGKAEYLVLMKIRQEWWDEDQKVLENRNADIMSTIFRGETISGEVQPGDPSQRYVKTALFQRPTRKGK